MEDSRRIAVVGTSCSGKTTFARQLSRALEVPHVELDVLHWGPNWTPRPDFRDCVDAATSADTWVIDGNYSKARDLVWPRATTLVWLNYPFGVVFSRAWSRTLRRLLTREQLFAGNRERWSGVIDPEWIPWWVVRTFHRRRREYPKLFRQPEHAHLEVIELNSLDQAESFLRAKTR